MTASNATKVRHWVGIETVSKEGLEQLFADAKRLEAEPLEQKRERLRGRVVMTMFFEPSTRTRLSFESAALRLGAGVSGFAEGETTSAKKGESLEDTVRMCAAYGDVLVLRHPVLGAASRAAKVSSVPVINAGDGTGEHPTQALVDLYTIQQRMGQIDGLHIGIVGDLCYGRTVHSLLLGLSKFRGIHVTCYSPSPKLALPEADLRHASLAGLTLHEGRNLRDIARSVDVLYMTRVQSERFPPEREGSTASSGLADYVLRAADLDDARRNMCILHPLPRVTELPVEIDALPAAAYFEQARNGVCVRQALLQSVLS
jgi:aspartate carbamoyltransferase catalytic subunit